VERIVESLALSLTAREHRLLKKDVPASPAAYEFYLRGNELSRRGLAGAETLNVARDLYVRGLEEDPGYAPAWARLGRCYVLIGKGVENAAENFAAAQSSFQRALELNPDLVLAHSLYAHLEAEVGRAEEAMVRLVGRARDGSAEPSLFAALVQCCRYCGLLQASLAAHERAHILDPQSATSVGHTLYQLGDYDGALRHANSGVWMLDAMALDSMGRPEEAVAILRKREQSGIPAPMRAFVRAWRALLEGHAKESLEAAEETVLHYIDPEGVFYMALVMSRLGETDRALAVLAESLHRGFCSFEALTRNPWLDSLRSHQKFGEILQAMKLRCNNTAKVYKDASGAGPQVRV
jgi:tetratricopeptide (TPR) repeat protein